MRNLFLAIIRAVEKILGMAPLKLKMELFRMAARSIGVKYAVFDGKQGVFEAPIYDRVIWPLYLAQGGLDLGTSDLIVRLFNSGSGTLIDVGANIGVVCIPAKRAVPGIDCYAIEADPGNCECLRMNAFRNGVPDIVLFNRAAYRHECMMNFERSSENSGDHRIRTNKSDSSRELCNESSRQVIQVQASTLDSIIPLSGLRGPVVIVCDVQGAEADVLAGAAKLLDSVDVMIIEFWPYGLKRAGANIDELLSFLSLFPHGARFDSMGSTPIHTEPVSELVEQLRRIYKEEAGIRHFDLVLSKKSF